MNPRFPSRLAAGLGLAALLAVAAGPARAQSLAYINEVDTNGVPVHLGDIVTTTARVTSIDFRSGFDVYPDNAAVNPPYIEVYFQEAGTTEAVRLLVAQSYEPAYNSGVLTIGDEFVLAYAEIIHAHGVTSLEVLAPSLDVVKTGAANAPIVPTPFTVAGLLAAPEDYEGALVSLTNLTITSGSWPAHNGSATLKVTDGTGAVDLRIDSDTNLDGQPRPTGAFDLVGIFTQYDTTEPYDSGYQLMPRFYTDILQYGVPPSPPRLVLTPGTTTSAGVGQAVEIGLFASDTNATDTLTFANVAGPGGSLTRLGDREAVWTWTAAGPGTTNTFTFTVSDGALSDTQSVDVVVLTLEQADIILNEFLADPDATLAGDANGDGRRDERDDEFVEIVNRNAGVDQDIGNWVLRNGTNVLFTFPAGTILTAQTAVVVFGGADTPLDPLQFGNAQVFTATPVGAGLPDWWGISNSGGPGNALSLTAANGAPIFSVVYGSLAGENQAVNLDPELTGTSYVLHSRLANSAGALFSPGTFANGSPFPGSGLANSPPKFDLLDSFSVRIGQTVSVVITASDIDGDPLALSVSNAPPTAVFTDHGDGTGTLAYTGQAADAGTHFNLVFTASDGTATATLQATLYVPTAQYSGLIINEFLPDPDLGEGVNHIDSNQDGVEDPYDDEFVEIVNLTGAPVELAGCMLSDATVFAHTFSPLEIPAGGAVVVFGGGSLANFSACPAQLASSGSLGAVPGGLNNPGDTISLWDPDTNLLDRVSYTDPGVPDAASLNRNPDITGDTFAIHSLVGAGPASPGTRADGSAFLADQPPSIVVSGIPLVRAGDTLELTVTASEPDGDAVTLVAVNLPANAAFTNTNGVGTVASTFRFTPANTQLGTVVATFVASDVDGATTNHTEITVVEGGKYFWDFETGLQGWTILSLASSEDWALTSGTGAEGSATYLSINGFSADVGCDDWLISPALDLTGLNLPALTFWIQRGYPGIEANRQFLVSTDYPGAGDPTLANWDVSVLPDPGDTPWPAPPQFLSLAAYAGATNLYVAFRYQSDGPSTDQHNWSVDQVRLIDAMNTPPTLIVPGQQVVIAGDTVSFTVSATEPDGDPITLSVSNKPASAVFTDAGDGTGTFEWATTLADTGTVVVTFAATDPDGSDSKTVQIAVLPPSTGECGLIFSEYVEGSSNNKAIELYNGTSAEIDFDAGSYVIDRYNNGSTDVSGTLTLTGTIASGGTYVIANPSAAAEVLAVADVTSTITYYNGDDALVLVANGVVIDSIGRVGEDPGSVWGTEPVTTGEHTLRRKPTVAAGDAVINDPYDPAIEWDGFAQDDFSGLGAHVSSCPHGGVVDTDGDGMSDAYEELYFGGPTNGVADVDEEFDGFKNLEEYIANTDPLDPNSFFSITVIDGATERQVTLGCTSSERVYTVEYTTDLADPDGWTPLAPAQAGTEPETVLLDPAPDDVRGYRGTVRLP